MRGKCSSLFSRHPCNDSLRRCSHTKIMKIMRILSFPERPPLSDHLSFYLNIISKKSAFITICASQIVCRSYDRYTDYREVRRFRHFPESSPLPDHFSFSLNIISKKSAFITICTSQIVCRSCDQYADYGEVR